MKGTSRRIKQKPEKQICSGRREIKEKLTLDTIYAKSVIL